MNTTTNHQRRRAALRVGAGVADVAGAVEGLQRAVAGIAGAVRAVARAPEVATDLMRIMLVGQAVSQSTAIYAMVVSLVLIFVV